MYTASIVNAVGDWTFGLLPIFMVRELNMSLRTKIAVSCILGFAAIGGTVTVVRIPDVATLVDDTDFLWQTTDFAILSTVEVGVGIVAAQEAIIHGRLSNRKIDQLHRCASQDNLKANTEPATMTFFIDDADSVANLSSGERSDVELGVIHETVHKA
ncbi:uncharacterized protein BHQ10_003611 [Talaromyces amestolkiae]|uniref:Rhodopsin domain-containing protein n=1 Tax=Talaromyces amestolkiae TaxID=1196081 RepID=A0A364KVN7_TALAM|nr:uncharacterized protein BHQ10_003611 [Talaromyces amestolkiae]RAO67599.1 hypothetical protein BHQ10_003611 [Talaromyces amestolkiae]